MTGPEPVSRDPMSRAACGKWQGSALIGTTAFVALMAVLSWASSLTGNRVETFGAIDVERNAISIVIRQEPPQLDTHADARHRERDDCRATRSRA